MIETNLKNRIGYWVNRLAMLIHHTFEAEIAKHGISAAEWCILISLYDRQADSVTELAKYIEIDKAAISRIVDKLVKRELVLVIPGKDRRSNQISITSKGKDLIPLLLAGAKDNEQNIFGHLSDEELYQLENIFSKIFSKLPNIKMDGWLKPNFTEEKGSI